MEREWQRLEYEEAASVFRQIDARIWNIYGLYLGGCGAAAAYLLTQAGELTHHSVIGLALAVIGASLGQMALVGHLQWGSDILAARLREIESEHCMDVHRRFIRDISSSHLRGAHRWWYELRARDIMQTVAWMIALLWFAAPFVHQGEAGSPRRDSVDLAYMLGGTAVFAVLLVFGARSRRHDRLSSE